MKSKPKAAFNLDVFLDAAGVSKKTATFNPGERIFSQGDPCDTVLYVRSGAVKLSVLSQAGRECVVGILGTGEFFGEGGLAGQPLRMCSASAVSRSTVLRIKKSRMVRLLHQQRTLSDRFIAHMLARNIRIEEDLIDQLFNSSEKRLARTLLRLARWGKPDRPSRVVPNMSQETLAEMIGTTD
jgi:CRP-like cAMP-binding protein